MLQGAGWVVHGEGTVRSSRRGVAGEASGSTGETAVEGPSSV